MRLKELTKGIEKERKAIIKDYTHGKHSHYHNELEKLNFDSLLETSKIAEILFQSKEMNYIKPKGYRLLGKLGLSEGDINMIVGKFSNIERIFEVKQGDKIFKDEEKTEKLIKEIAKLKEDILLGKNF